MNAFHASRQGKLPVTGIAREPGIEAPWMLDDEVISAPRQLR